MQQDKFEELLLDRLDTIDNRFDKLGDRISALDQKVDEKISALENKLDEKTSAIENRIGSLEQTTSWIKGKLEG